MDPLQFLVPLGWLEVAGPILPIAILLLGLANVATRLLAHRRHVRQAEDDDRVERFVPHSVTTFVLVLLALLFIPYAPVGGTILAFIAVTLLVADVFEFEARNVEARNEMTIEKPKSAMVASGLVIVYGVYYTLVALNLTFWQSLFA